MYDDFAFDFRNPVANFMIVHRKVRKAAEVFATTGKRWSKSRDNAMDMAAAMGIELLTEEQYRALQDLGQFDTKTSSWVKTPSAIRQLGGALFCDRRFDTFLCITTVRSPTMPPGDSVVR
jgi:hypothetical protein